MLGGFTALWSEPDLVALFLLKSRSHPQKKLLLLFIIYFFTHLIFKKAGINSVGVLTQLTEQWDAEYLDADGSCSLNLL